MQTKNVFRVFVHRREGGDEDWSEKSTASPGINADVRTYGRNTRRLLWYEFYTPEEADACVSAFAGRKTLTKGKRDAEVLLERVVAARHRARENFEIAAMFDVYDWWFGHAVHLVYPQYSGAPDGYYVGFVYDSRMPRAHGIQMTAVNRMTRYGNDFLRDCVIFRAAIVSRTG